MKAYLHLVHYAIGLGYAVSLPGQGEAFDEWDVRESTNWKEIVGAIEAVGEAYLHFHREGKRHGIALVSAYGLEPEETVIDHSTTAFLTEWSENYNAYTYAED